MEILKLFANSFIFWAAWIVIPVIMEILPSVGSVVILIKKIIKGDGDKEQQYLPEISLIMPVYNSAATLEACIRSVDESDYPNERIRVFLVNNQGKDNSFEIFTKCQSKYPDLHMQWLNAKQGKSRALNLALFNSEGKYIINIDSDGLLEKSALRNMVNRFESHPDMDCMTGTILIDPKQIEPYPWIFPKLFRKLEFMEYAQAFLAGRNYANETNSIYTLSGAFSAFRKSSVLKSQMYNTDTVGEDTQITFQMKYIQGRRVGICEDAIFMVDPIEDVNKLYTQRQRWQRGSLEVSHMFFKDKMNIGKIFTDASIRTLLYDHTFAFPRIIWYLAMFCLLFMNYSLNLIVFSTVFLFALYIVLGYLYYIAILGFLRPFPEIRTYYRNQWYIVPLLPLFNLGVFFIRFFGIINSISTSSAWKTRNLTEERKDFTDGLRRDFHRVETALHWIRRAVNIEE